MDENREILRTYTDIWNVPFKVYSIDNMKLIVPISPYDVIYYMVGLLFAVAVDYIYPGTILFMYKFIVIPLLIRFLLTRVKLDGKRPHKFFFGMLMYKLTNKRQEFFRPVEKQALKNFKGESIIFYKRNGDQI